MNKQPKALISFLVFGYAFLYAPIITLIIFSFNKSRLVSVWTGFSTKWYLALLENDAILQAAWISLKIATMTASLSVLIGTLGATTVIRLKDLKGRSILEGLTTAPLVMPDVILGLSLLLVFVFIYNTFGWPARGLTTITIAHTTLAVAYVFVIVRERLRSFDHSLEEAARDLGARPVSVFFRITLPLISPSLLAGWLLAFTLSLDDVVIASFVSGAGSTTLPMVIFSSVRVGVTPEINALATVMIGFVTIGVIIAGILTRPGRDSRKRRT